MWRWFEMKELYTRHKNTWVQIVSLHDMAMNICDDISKLRIERKKL